MFEIQYACIYRGVWYSDSEQDNWPMALARAQYVYSLTGRSIRIVASGSGEVYRLPGRQHPDCG